MYKKYINCIKNDLYRYTGSYKGLLKSYLFNPGFKYTCLMRLEYFLSETRKKSLLLLLVKLRKRHYSFKYGIQIPGITKIGKGFYIGHFGTIVVNSNAIIGDNVNISQGVTIGQANRGRNEGTPIIGNEVYIGPGAKIVGNVKIGNNVAIGANAVVTKDVPTGAVVVGIPAKIISMNGSAGYINRKV